MKNERIKELKNFADDFNKRLQSSEIDSEEIAIYKKINNKNNILNKSTTFTSKLDDDFLNKVRKYSVKKVNFKENKLNNSKRKTNRE